MNAANTLLHFFVPRYSNNHKARILHSEIILAFGVFLLLVQGFINTAASSKIAILGYASNISVEEVVNLTNQKRAEAGVGSLSINSQLSAAAVQKGQDMLANNYWAHISPTGVEPWDFFANVGYSYKYAGENLARDFSNPNDAVNAWMASPSHRENLLSNKYSEIGIGVVEGDLNGVDTTIIVQLFGTQANQPAAVPEVAANTTTSPQTETIFVPEVQAEEASPVINETEQIVDEKIEDDAELIESEPLSTPVPETANVKTTTPLDATKYISLFVMGLLSVVLIIDVVEVERRGINRIGGRNTAHISYLVILMIIVLISKAGEIL